MKILSSSARLAGLGALCAGAVFYGYHSAHATTLPAHIVESGEFYPKTDAQRRALSMFDSMKSSFGTPESGLINETVDSTSECVIAGKICSAVYISKFNQNQNFPKHSNIRFYMDDGTTYGLTIREDGSPISFSSNADAQDKDSSGNIDHVDGRCLIIGLHAIRCNIRSLNGRNFPNGTPVLSFDVRNDDGKFAMWLPTQSDQMPSTSANSNNENSKPEDARQEYDLAVKIYNGNGAPENHQKALELFKDAADKGYDEAQFRLGLMYALGIEVSKDQHIATKWLAKAANQGNAGAQYILGTHLCTGTGVALNPLAGRYWLQEAIKHGKTEAQRALRECR